MYVIERINKESLRILEPLLQASFGETFDLCDELDYFERMPHGSWFYISSDKQPQGFIRCFEIENKLFQIELYAEPSTDAINCTRVLLEFFKNNNTLEESSQIRFEIEEYKTELLDLLKEIFPIHLTTRYLYMQKRLQSSESIANQSSHYNESIYSKIATIFGGLKYYTDDEICALIKKEKLSILFESDIPVAALHLEPKSCDTCEIITLATDPAKQNKGYGIRLLNAFLKNTSYRIIELKVDDKNTKAVSLYNRMGFRIIPGRVQQWCYVKIRDIRTW